MQEEVNIVSEGYKKAIKELGMNRLPGTITGGAGTGGTFGNYERNNTSLAFPTAVAYGARASAPADPSGFVRGAMSGKIGGTMGGINSLLPHYANLTPLSTKPNELSELSEFNDKLKITQQGDRVRITSLSPEDLAWQTERKKNQSSEYPGYTKDEVKKALEDGDYFEDGEFVSKDSYLNGSRIRKMIPDSNGKMQYTTDADLEKERMGQEPSGQVAVGQATVGINTQNGLGQFDAKEMGMFASSMSQSLGDMTRRKTESAEQFTKRRTKMLSKQYVQSKPWENFARKTNETDEDFENRIGSEQKKMSQTQEAIQMAGKMRYDKKGLSKERGQETVMETMGGKGFTSADAKKGIALPTEDVSASMYMEAGGGGGGGGGASGIITVELSSELKGTINEMHGILLKINDSAGTKR
jgi:hypothetical protein